MRRAPAGCHHPLWPIAVTGCCPTLVANPADLVNIPALPVRLSHSVSEPDESESAEFVDGLVTRSDAEFLIDGERLGLGGTPGDVEAVSDFLQCEVGCEERGESQLGRRERCPVGQDRRTGLDATAEVVDLCAELSESRSLPEYSTSLFQDVDRAGPVSQGEVATGHVEQGDDRNDGQFVRQQRTQMGRTSELSLREVDPTGVDGETGLEREHRSTGRVLVERSIADEI